MTKFRIDDHVRVKGEQEIGQIVNIGYSERMAEVIYIVDYKNRKRKDLESQIKPAQISATVEEFDQAAVSVVDSYLSTAFGQDMDDEELDKLVEFVRNVCADLKGALFDGM